jgi:hypothetical protein
VKMQFHPHKEQNVASLKATYVCHENSMKHTNRLCEQNSQLLNIKAGRYIQPYKSIDSYKKYLTSTDSFHMDYEQYNSIICLKLEVRA